METSTYAFLGLIIFAMFATLTWRMASRRHSLPCPVWLRWMVELDNPFTKTNRAAEIIRHLDLQQGMVVLDAGCGPGRLTIPVARSVGEQGEVVAMDIQAGMLDRVRVKATASEISNIQFLEAGVGEGRLQQFAFDRALLVTVLGEIPNREAALQEIFNGLKPGGILSITEIIFDPHFQRRAKVRQLTDAAGFREKHFFGNRIAYTLLVEKPSTMQ
jgi:ubiquinone/menaquinone biosynthesis C-methylase UbiE